MGKLEIKYRTAGKGLAPQPPGLPTLESDSPLATTLDHGAEPQPWRQVSFGAAAAYGVELVYQYQTECHVINDTGQIRIEWDYKKEPGGVLGFDEFDDTVPKPSISFIFATSVDLQAPPGYVLRTEPHPRFFTDTTGTVPPALCGHIRSEWWPKKLFVVFKAPPRGQRYIFRKGEPYVQILFVPQDTIFEPKPISTGVHPRSLDLERAMDLAKSHLDVNYRATGKAFPPQPIGLEIPGWSGSPEMKMENGLEPQPWHCSPFREGATYGVELLYQYEAECQVINDNGQIRFDWNQAKRPAAVPGDNAFVEIGQQPCQFYSFATSVELQAPAGHVLRTEVHPRFYTDRSDTVPVAICGQVKADDPRQLCVVFKAPAPGQRHVFRKGEPYVQILFVPEAMSYETKRMSREEETQRLTQESGILLAKSYIAKHVWHNPNGLEFNDHYRVLQRAFEHHGLAGVRATIQAGVERQQRTVPRGKTIAEYLNMADEYQRAGKHLEAKETLVHARGLDPNNPEVANRVGLLQWTIGLRKLALAAMEAAVRLQPQSAEYRSNLGDMFRQLGRHGEALASLRMSLDLKPNDPLVMSKLELVLAALDREAKGLATDERG